MSDNNTVNAILAQYEENTKRNAGAKTNTSFDLRNYFTTFLEKGVNQKTLRIRILPGEENDTPFKHQIIHSIQMDGQWKKFACPEHNDGNPCPFCEAREALLAEGTEKSKELAKTYNTRKTYVVKLVDREDEEWGPKFWRFNHDYRGIGVMDKIIPIIKAKGDITDVETGRDLIITVSRDQNNRPNVSSIIFDDVEPLHAEKATKEKWLNDTKVWRDVYKVKAYEFLYIIVQGEEPYYDKTGKKWVAKSEFEANAEPITMGADEALPLSKEDVVANKEAMGATTPPAKAEEEEDDLPF